jgi:hypothetical protein
MRSIRIFTDTYIALQHSQWRFVHCTFSGVHCTIPLSNLASCHCGPSTTADPDKQARKHKYAPAKSSKPPVLSYRVSQQQPTKYHQPPTNQQTNLSLCHGIEGGDNLTCALPDSSYCPLHCIALQLDTTHYVICSTS